LARIPIIPAPPRRTYRGTLGPIVKTYTLRAFVRHNVINFVRNRCLLFIRIKRSSITEIDDATQGGAFGEPPTYTRVVYCIVRAFGLASPAIYAFICYLNCHLYLTLTNMIK